ncbi:hypothetical protein [Enterobacter cloacae]|uniref:hypothetical protein n=1 Tax=Enterobacter cloacae TaxID=550 RepID=UPI002FF77206
MNERIIRQNIEDIRNTTSTCENGADCITLLLNTRRLFFSIPSQDHLTLIDIAEEEFSISFDDKSCRQALNRCTHPNDFDPFTDVDFRRG